MNHTRFLFSLFLVTLLPGCGRLNEKAADRLDITQVKLIELSGQTIDLTQYEGKVVFINFWATWCKPCLQEMPTIESAQEILKNENIVFLLASNESQEEIEGFSKRRDYHFHYARLDNLEALKIEALPTTFIFDAHGELKFSEAGYRQWDTPENINMIKSIITGAEK